MVIKNRLLLTTLYLLVIFFVISGCGSKAPNLTVQNIKYVVNNEEPKTAEDEDYLQLQTGDKFCLIDLEYYADQRGASEERVAVEAYIRKNGREEADIDYDDGRFSSGLGIQEGTHSLGAIKFDKYRDVNPCWQVDRSWNRAIIVLVHYYPKDIIHWNEFEVDDRFYVNLKIE